MVKLLKDNLWIVYVHEKCILFCHIARSSFSYAGNIWEQVINIYTTNIVAIQVILGPLSMSTRMFHLSLGSSELINYPKKTLF